MSVPTKRDKGFTETLWMSNIPNLKLMPELVLSIGESSFTSRMLMSLSNGCRGDHLSLIHLENNSHISFIGSANSEQLKLSQALQQLYLSTYFQFDPNYNLLNKLNSDQPSKITRLQPDEIKNGGYRELWYKKMGIIDRVSVVCLADKGLYCLNLFRNKKPFSDKEISFLEQNQELLCSFIVKHSRLTGSLSPFLTREAQLESLIERLKNVNSTLTTREKEVGARILLGINSEGIALDLGIKTQSVHTYRKRAYLKLNINSQNELFALCLLAT